MCWHGTGALGLVEGLRALLPSIQWLLARHLMMLGLGFPSLGGGYGVHLLSSADCGGQDELIVVKSLKWCISKWAVNLLCGQASASGQ